MQQNANKMQDAGEFRTVWRFPKHTEQANFHPLTVGEWEIKQKFVGKDYDYEHFNCATLIVLVYAELGKDIIIDPTQCGEENLIAKMRHGFFDNYAKQWEKVSDPAFPDIVLFENSHGVIYHGGIMLKDNRVLHNCIGAGVIITKLKDILKSRKLNGFYRCKL